jgi:bifunctional UDP-N-acetylglucosamine pyrophosphorylase / glucosamine-1-phosphate N-acetyltransferase
VMLNQPPIFLGGQGGAVGPLRLGYGTVVAAGSVLRDDVPEDGKLVFAAFPPGSERVRRSHAYKNLSRIVRNNVVYLGNLVALENWYRKVREPFFAAQDMGALIYGGALEVLSAAKEERTKRLAAMAEKVPMSGLGAEEFRERVGEVCSLFAGHPVVPGGEAFLAGLARATAGGPGEYVKTIQGLTPALSNLGVEWLQAIVDTLCGRADAHLASMDLFTKNVRAN